MIAPDRGKPRSRLRRAGVAGLGLLAVLLAYLSLWPVPVDPVVWEAAAPPGYAGPHERNDRLAGLNLIPLGGEVGPEHVAFGPDGRLYASVESGRLLRLDPEAGSVEPWVETGGRVLGFDFDAQGRMIAADAMRGLLAIDPDGTLEVLADRVGDDPIRYANSVVVARSGLIYFTDASGRFAPREAGGTFLASIFDILEQRATGRVLELEPASRRVRAIMTGLSFANGVALSADERSLFIAETGRYRVWKLPLDGSAGPRVLLDNLPGYPDNLMRGLEGRIWLGFAKPRSALVDRLAGRPSWRKVTLRLPRALWPVPPAYGHVIAFDEEGRVLADLQDPGGAYPETTGVTETADRLYIQSLHAPALGWLPRAGLQLGAADAPPPP
jgi:sugar lactone lactonase YvrE